MSRKQSKTVRATWPDGVVMMFGNSYRSWFDQLAEYCRMQKRPRPEIAVSDEPWIGFGGLKWCSVDDFQNQLDIEGSDRRVSDFSFRKPTPIEVNCLSRIRRLSP